MAVRRTESERIDIGGTILFGRVAEPLFGCFSLFEKISPKFRRAHCRVHVHRRIVGNSWSNSNLSLVRPPAILPRTPWLTMATYRADDHSSFMTLHHQQHQHQLHHIIAPGYKVSTWTFPNITFCNGSQRLPQVDHRQYRSGQEKWIYLY